MLALAGFSKRYISTLAVYRVRASVDMVGVRESSGAGRLYETVRCRSPHYLCCGFCTILVELLPSMLRDGATCVTDY
jgi:hypothetical protein